jgi:pyruvate/2-oxoglutarate dehydrogenase complex dihydrolipoamide dehydrogenase (E3) component
MAEIKTDICIIGAGAAGLSVAAGAVQMGAKAVLIEQHIRDGFMGGDCLHTGCVPSKALLAAAKHAYGMGQGAPFGIAPATAHIDFPKVHDHVHEVIGAIAPVDSVTRFTDLGVKVIEGTAQFTGPRTLEVNGRVIRAKFFVIATGSTPATPPIPGLDTVPYFTNETLFDNTALPRHLVIIGGGPIGAEMAQAHRRLGAEVTLIEGATFMGRDDPELVSVVRQRLIGEGVTILEGAKVTGVCSQPQSEISVAFAQDGQTRSVSGSHLLVAVGRTPAVSGLDLEKAGIAYSPNGIEVDARLRTTNKRIFAIGDVAGGPQFTHVAGYHAGIAIRNMLYRIPAKADLSAVPHVTYTDPELAHVGLTQAEAEGTFGPDKIRVLRSLYAENDRAQAERKTEGLIKVILKANGEILGASIVGEGAGELLQPWILALSAKLKISAFAGMIAPYPTLGEISKRAAGAFYTPFLFGARNRLIVQTLLKLP